MLGFPLCNVVIAVFVVTVTVAFLCSYYKTFMDAHLQFMSRLHEVIDLLVQHLRA